ncbi:MAG: GGDEF domain-containing protein [Pseudomonadota bacterium]
MKPITPPPLPLCKSCDTISELTDTVQQLENRYQSLQHQATHDDLTGALRRNHFFDLSRRQFSLARRHGRPLSLLLIDLDHFKVLNDEHGHAFGDEALRTIAELCQENLRETDIFGRYGGEEFAVTLPETGAREASIVAERIRQKVEARGLATPQGQVRHCSVSIGIAEQSGALTSLEALIDAADRAMYQAKAAGRNSIRSHSPNHI